MPPKHRAIIIGAGRMGAGFPDPALWSKRYAYTHAEAYAALRDRVELFAFVDPDPERRAFAADNFAGVQAVDSLEAALAVVKPTIVSVCTPPAQRLDIMDTLIMAGVKGVWCEKPLMLKAAYFSRENWPTRELPKVQVNYIRRFDPLHRALWVSAALGRPRTMHVRAKKDIHTVCHFTDLARFLSIHRENLTYEAVDGPCSYTMDREEHYADGGIPDGSPFMVNALTNLLDAVDGDVPLISPPESAIESEKWASDILENA